MARAWRIEYEEALYHVLSRGNEKQDIVINDDDRRLFLITAGEMAERFEIDIFAYVLMDNHYHIVVETIEGNLSISKGMRQLNGVYTQQFNRTHERGGHSERQRRIPRG